MKVQLQQSTCTITTDLYKKCELGMEYSYLYYLNEK